MPKPKPELKKTKHTDRFYKPRPQHDQHNDHDREQNVTVNVTINQPAEDGVTGCFKSLFSCAKAGAS